MNRSQIFLLWCGVVACVGLALYPPWLRTAVIGRYPAITTVAERAPIWKGPVLPMDLTWDDISWKDRPVPPEEIDDPSLKEKATSRAGRERWYGFDVADRVTGLPYVIGAQLDIARLTIEMACVVMITGAMFFTLRQKSLGTLS